MLLYISGVFMLSYWSRFVSHARGDALYRCHFTKAGRIAQGENLDAEALAQAIREGWRLLIEKAPADALDGFEIWQCATFLYSSAHNSHGGPDGRRSRGVSLILPSDHSSEERRNPSVCLRIGR
jgi:hypothetical protein